MKLWSDFYPYITLYLTGCPYPVIDGQLRQSAIDFCERSGAWREWLDPVTTAEGTKQYNFNVSSSQEVVQVIRATLGNDPVNVVSSDDLSAGWMDSEPSTQGIVTFDRRSFFLLQTPPAGLNMAIDVTLKPSQTAEGISDALFAHYAKAIAYGAASELMLAPGKPFSNQQLSVQFGERFDDAVARAGIEKFRASGRTARRTNANFF